MTSGSLLFAPLVPESQSVNQPIRLTVNRSPTASTPSAHCSPESGPFVLKQTDAIPSKLQLTLPSPQRWLDDLQGKPEPDGSDSVASLYTFLDALDRSQEAGCFFGESITPREFVLQSLPMKPPQSLFNGYGYLLERSGLDMKPGLQLKIDRAYFSAPSTGEEEQAIKNYLGVSSISFEVRQDGEGGIDFEQLGDIIYLPESLARKSNEGVQDLRLGSLQRQPHYRLLFYTYVVPKEHRISAAIVGAATESRLNELEMALRGQSDLGCKNASLGQTEQCFEFAGFVTLSAQVNVEINGNTKYVDWGTNVAGLLPDKFPKSLRMQRKFLGDYYDVHFDAKDENILQLAVVGGDRLTWTKDPNPRH